MMCGNVSDLLAFFCHPYFDVQACSEHRGVYFLYVTSATMTVVGALLVWDRLLLAPLGRAMLLKESKNT